LELFTKTFLSGLSELDEVEPDTGSPGPKKHRLGNELRAIVKQQGPRQQLDRAEFIERPG